jgi:hypothetical protein
VKNPRLAPLAFAALAALCAPPAAAVYLSMQGEGQALLFPYYTVRSAGGNAFNTYVSVTNTGDASVVAKVRFREGRNSKVVAEFNLYLSGRDMWTAALVPDGAGTRLVTSDPSCTNPALPAGGLPFSTGAFADGGNDGAGTGPERTQEGHIEVIEMATLPTNVAGALSPYGGRNCAAVQGLTPDLGTLAAPTDSLAGNATLINVQSGLDAGYVADALAGLVSTAFYSAPGFPGTDFDAPEVDAVSAHIIDNVSYRMLWSNGLQAVNAALTSQILDNEFVLDPATASKTDWVITFPTRHLLVTSTSAQPPFSAPFGTGALVATSCEGATIEAWDREGVQLLGNAFPEEPPSPFRVCWSATAFSMRTTITAWSTGPSDVLGAANTLGFGPFPLPPDARGPAPVGVPMTSNGMDGHIALHFQSGGVSFALPGTTWVDLKTGTTGTGAVALPGYPAIGFMVRTFENGTLACGGAVCQGNYASAFSYRRAMSVIPR